MNYNYILNYEDFKRELLRSNKEYFTRKDGIPNSIVDCLEPSKIETIVINIHLPEETNKDNGYVPMELFREHYKKGKNGWYQRKESGRDITFPFVTKRYYYSKKELLKECNKHIKDYTKNINRAILNTKNRIKEEEERLKKLEDLLLN